ncbi:polymorphic toxin-type HINT domain-containing protein [Amycolatopsis sp. TRM77291]
MTAVFGVLGSADAQAEPRNTAGQPSGAPARKAPPKKANNSGSANAAEKKVEKSDKLKKDAEEKRKRQGSSSSAIADRDVAKRDKDAEERRRGRVAGSSAIADREVTREDEKGARAPVRMPEHLRELLYGKHKPEHTDPLLMPRSDKPVPRDGSSTAGPLPVRPPEKSVLAQVEESVEDTVGGALSTARDWAQDEIDRERAAEDKNADWLTLGRRAAAGGYASLHDGAQQAGKALDLLNRAKDGDPEAQRQIEKYAQDAAEGIANTATDAWNDPQGTWNRAVESTEKAVEDFKDAPASSIGGILSDVVGPGKFARPLKAVDAVTPDRDRERASDPVDEGGAPGTLAPAGGQPNDATGRDPRSTMTDARRSDDNAGSGPVVVPMPVTQVPNLSRPGRSADRPSKDSTPEGGSSRRDARESAGAPSRTSGTRPSDKPVTDRDAERDSGRAVNDRTGAAEQPDRCPANSFVPGTAVLLADGTYKPIEQVRLGDQVLATDPVTGLTQARPVINLIPGQGMKELVRITVDTDGDHGDATGTVTATDEHPFWVADTGRWTDAEDLDRGHLLRTPDGRVVKVIDVHTWIQPQQVHNLTVEGLHTYYVRAQGGSVGADLLTHNICVEPGQDGADETLGRDDPGDELEARPAPQQAVHEPIRNRVKLRQSTKRAIYRDAERQPDGSGDFVCQASRERIPAARNPDGSLVRINPDTGKPDPAGITVPEPGKFEFGHQPGSEWWRYKTEAKAGDYTRKKVIEDQNDPGRYRLETPAANRSHKYELPP